MIKKDSQKEIIAEYYMGLRDYAPNEKYSDPFSTIYATPGNDYWLVLARRGDNEIQARVTDGTGIVVSWDDYLVKNADIKPVGSVRQSAVGRKQVLFTTSEVSVIDKYGESARMEKAKIAIDKHKAERDLPTKVHRNEINI